MSRNQRVKNRTILTVTSVIIYDTENDNGQLNFEKFVKSVQLHMPNNKYIQ